MDKVDIKEHPIVKHPNPCLIKMWEDEIVKQFYGILAQQVLVPIKGEINEAKSTSKDN